MPRNLVPLAALVLLFAIATASAQDATCAPVSEEAAILASADPEDFHPDWEDSLIGLSWTLALTGEEEDANGEFYLIGDLIDPRGNVVTEGVYVNVMEWECDVPD